MTQNKTRDDLAFEYGDKENAGPCCVSSFSEGFTAAEKQYMGEIELLKKKHSQALEENLGLARRAENYESLKAELADKDLTIQVISKNSLEMKKDLEIAAKALENLDDACDGEVGCWCGEVIRGEEVEICPRCFAEETLNTLKSKLGRGEK